MTVALRDLPRTEYHKVQSIYKRDQRGNFTDEYSTPEIKALASSRIWTATEKVDGTNIRVTYRPTTAEEGGSWVTLGGRTDRAQIPADLANWLHRKFTVDNLIPVFGDEAGGPPTVLYGEGYGVGIQSGGKYLPDVGEDEKQQFTLFDVQCGGLWLARDDVRDIAENLGVSPVPEVATHVTLDWAEALVRDGLNSRWGDFEAEGLVLRCHPDLFDRSVNRIITKVKAKDFR